jgi:hypothetical protein
MTNEERQRTMDFILQQQAQFAASQPRLAELQQSFKTLVQLATIAEERMDNGEFRVTALETRSAALEASMARLAEAQARADAAQAHADERVSALIDIILEGRNGPS